MASTMRRRSATVSTFSGPTFQYYSPPRPFKPVLDLPTTPEEDANTLRAEGQITDENGLWMPCADNGFQVPIEERDEASPLPVRRTRGRARAGSCSRLIPPALLKREKSAKEVAKVEASAYDKLYARVRSEYAADELADEDVHELVKNAINGGDPIPERNPPEKPKTDATLNKAERPHATLYTRRISRSPSSSPEPKTPTDEAPIQRYQKPLPRNFKSRRSLPLA
ncbi:hypothetical protein CYLTODRAFT_493880 [Cylindrobasidium torrendii FP15055 ss-10]|uniref:Uncharacterized protein n=1 Tax=Cylindrobasidium torrendii FP15055 ss-10 TaxID=1314674 RepID=A0A0D7AYN9_9AGAR|nr:hypothetical protein CYLTODRAFT_493880 [Cylindrobasidium torrendii FP15055 ss-10]